LGDAAVGRTIGWDARRVSAIAAVLTHRARMQITPLEQFKVPLGGQEIELQELVHDGGGMKLLRIRIRERVRFTIFDVDPATARRWGEAMVRWAATQPGGGHDGAG
jgi:hypothetical protein